MGLIYVAFYFFVDKKEFLCPESAFPRQTVILKYFRCSALEIEILSCYFEFSCILFCPVAYTQEFYGGGGVHTSFLCNMSSKLEEFNKLTLQARSNAPPPSNDPKDVLEVCDLFTANDLRGKTHPGLSGLGKYLE